MTQKELNSKLRELQKEYLKVARKNDAEALRIATEMFELAKGTPLEKRQALVLSRHTKEGPRGFDGYPKGDEE